MPRSPPGSATGEGGGGAGLAGWQRAWLWSWQSLQDGRAIGCWPRRSRLGTCAAELGVRSHRCLHLLFFSFLLPQGREFWLVSNRFLARLYTSPLVTVAAIRGAPAAFKGPWDVP